MNVIQAIIQHGFGAWEEIFSPEGPFAEQLAEAAREFEALSKEKEAAGQPVPPQVGVPSDKALALRLKNLEKLLKVQLAKKGVMVSRWCALGTPPCITAAARTSCGKNLLSLGTRSVQ